MEAKASARYVKMSPRKIRVVANLVRGKNVDGAIQTLTFVKRAAAVPVKKLIESAVANAQNIDSAVDVESLYIKDLQVDMGPAKNMRRWRPRAMGRATRINKGISHINVVLDIR